MDAVLLPSSSLQPDTDPVAGGQAIRRAFQLLRGIAEHGGEGVRVSDLAQEAGLSVPTTHRMLRVLTQEGMVEQCPTSRRYRLGTGYIVLAQTAGRASLNAHYRAALEALAAKLGCSVYLSVRIGNDMLCIDRVTGDSPIRVVPYDIGARRPLGVGAAGIALLAQEPPAKARAIATRNAAAYARYGMTLPDVERMVEACRKRGYSYHGGRFIPGVAGLGMWVRDPCSQAVAAINIAVLAPELARTARRDEIAALMRTEIGYALGGSSIGA